MRQSKRLNKPPNEGGNATQGTKEAFLSTKW